MSRKPLDDADEIARRVWDAWQHHRQNPQHFVAVRARVRALLREYPYYAVLATCLSIVERAGSGFGLGHMSYASFALAHDALEVPAPEAWLYQYLLQTEPSPRVRDSISYWLDMWEDGLVLAETSEATGEAMVAKARRNLDDLYRYHCGWPANVLQHPEMVVELVGG